MIGLPFSKALVSIAFISLILISFISLFQKRKLAVTHRLLLLPIFLFFSLSISLFYSTNISKGLDILLSNIEFLAIPFIFTINYELIKKQFIQYIQLLVNATTLAAFLTFIFFLLPTDVTQTIAATVPLLKDYVVHEKALAFGVYSPFTERLQFSYLIGGAILLQLWKTIVDGTRLTVDGITGHFRLLILISTLLILGARGAQLSFLVASLVWIMGGYFYWLHPILSKKFSDFFAYLCLIIGLTFFLILVPFSVYQTITPVKVRYDQMHWEIGTFKDGTFKNYEYTHFTSIRRLMSWKNSWSIIQENPILGVGIGDYQNAMKKAYTKDHLGFPVNTQSQFLYYWVAAGLLSLITFLGYLGYSLLVFIQQKKFWFKLLGISFLVFYFILFLFDAPLNFQVGAMTFLTIFCLLASNIVIKPHTLIHS